MTQNILIKASEIYKSYSLVKGISTPVIKNVSLEIAKGEFISLVGPSGVGKSTLLHILGSIEKPDSGKIEIFLEGIKYDYSILSDAELSSCRNKNIGFIFQFHHLLPEFTALENVMMPALIAGESFSNSKDKAIELLEIVNMLHRKEHKPAELSGGEQQRIAIARALLNRPSIIFADEPTGNLDSVNAKAILNLLLDVHKKFEITLVVATHSTEIANSANKILTMGDGQILKD